MKEKEPNVKCDYCGADLYRTQSELNKNNHYFCNRKCQGNWKKENQQGKNNPNYKETTWVEIECLVCKTKKKVKRTEVDRGFGKFCSRKCMSEFQKKRSLINCSFCDEEFEIENRKLEKQNNYFCSNDCRLKWFSIVTTGENNHNYKERITVQCSYCNSDIIRVPSLFREGQTTYFCNRDCKAKYQEKIGAVKTTGIITNRK